MEREKMVEAAMQAIARQDTHDVGGVTEIFAEDVSFMMPVLAEPLRGRAALTQNVHDTWPESETSVEWTVVEGNRLVLCFSWRGKGDDWPADAPLLRGISTFVFDDDGLVSEYEDWFDPDWMTRHPAAPDSASA